MSLTMDIKVADNGRLILPQQVRLAMGLHGEGRVILTLVDDEVRLSPMGHGVTRAKELYRKHAKPGRTTDDFLGDQKIEASNDGVEAPVTVVKPTSK